MGWKDTVMSNEETAHIIFGCEGTAKEAWDEVNKAQAEISWKAAYKYALEGAVMEGAYESIKKLGIKEVVDWIRETAIMGYKEDELGVKSPTDLVVDLYSWQAKLKEWEMK